MSETITVRVRSVTELTERIRAYELVPAERGGRLPPFTAGAHVGIRLPSGAERHYSLLNDPAEAGRYVLAVQREDGGRGGSAEVHARLHVGERLSITPPRNHFPLAETQGASLLVAGGIGLTPILSMVRSLTRAGAPFRLIHLARDAESAPFLDELDALRDAGHPVAWHFDGGDPSRAYDLAGFLAGAGASDHVYCCGPAGLMEAVRRLTEGWAPERVHFEHFSNADAAPRAADAGFTVHLARSGRSVAVAPRQTILDALLAEGLDVDYSCCEGTCGTCIVPLLSGDPDHRDTVLTPAERADSIVICCSRARSPALALDI